MSLTLRYRPTDPHTSGIIVIVRSISFDFLIGQRWIDWIPIKEFSKDSADVVRQLAWSTSFQKQRERAINYKMTRGMKRNSIADWMGRWMDGQTIFCSLFSAGCRKISDVSYLGISNLALSLYSVCVCVQLGLLICIQDEWRVVSPSTPPPPPHLPFGLPFLSRKGWIERKKKCSIQGNHKQTVGHLSCPVLMSLQSS